MKKVTFFTLLCMLFTLAGCGNGRPAYQSVDEYPVREGALDEMVYSPSKTVFSVWSPAADSVVLRLYAEGIGGEALESHKMKRQADGTWKCTLRGNKQGLFYTFQVDSLQETPGIFAKAVGVNGRRGAVIDLQAAQPEGWETDVRPAFAGAQDAIVYEMHHRDFSIHTTSGITHKGKFLALTEEGTQVADGQGMASGIAHLKELGVTHVQILPSYDYGSIDETRLADNNYNWGYDPVNYNAPEGGYSTNPYDPACRITEMKAMIQALHKAGIRVVMDVIYSTHTHSHCTIIA